MFPAKYIHSMIMCTVMTPLLYAGTGSQTWSLLTDYREHAARKASSLMTPPSDVRSYRRIVEELSDYYMGIADIPGSRIMTPHTWLSHTPGAASRCAWLKALYPRCSFSDIMRSQTFRPEERKCTLDIYTIGKNVIDREREYADTHFFLYHGMSKENYVAMCINTYLDHFVNGTPLSSDFLKLRAESELYDDTHGQPLRKYSQADIHDDKEPYRTQLLPVSVTFPSQCKPVETAIYFFKNGSNMSHEALEKTLACYSIDKNVASHLRAILSDILERWNLDTKGTVLQIGIPKETINTCVYLSNPRGGLGHATLSTRNAFDMSQSNITKLEAHLDKPERPSSLQARIRLNYSLFSQPGQVKIFVHHGLPQEMLDELYDKVYEVLYAPNT